MSAPTAVAAPDDMPPLNPWRTLARATYGVTDSQPAGAAVRIDAGHIVRVFPGPSADIAEMEIRLSSGKPAPVHFFVSASGLRFSEPR